MTSKDNEKKPPSFSFKSDADSAIERKGLNERSDDEEDLSIARSKGSFHLFAVRSFIRLKNHIATIPLLLSVVTTIVFTFNRPTHINALVSLSNQKSNAFLFFVNVVLSFLIVLCYLNAQSRKAKKKKAILFFSLFALLTAMSIFLDAYHIHDIKVETSLYNSLNAIKDEGGYVAKSLSLTLTHIVLLSLTLLFASLVPLLQPLCKKIHLRKKKTRGNP